MMATTPLPQDEMAKVLDSNSSGKPRLRCSDTIHDSNAENRRLVDNPPRTRPKSNAGMDGMCSSKLMTISRTQKMTHPSFRPHLST